jgi:hypothetical protein
LTTPIHGLENYAEMIRALTEDRDAIKVFVEVAHDDRNATSEAALEPVAVAS